MSLASHKALFESLNDAIKRETRLKRRVGRPLTRARWGYFIFQAVLFLAALIFSLFYYITNSADLRSIGLIILIFFYLTALAAPFFFIWQLRRPIKSALQNPASIMLANARIAAAIDARIISKIMLQPKDDIEFIILEVKAEKENFERRTPLTVGAIEKVGILPGLLAALISYQTLPSGGSLWISSLAYAIPLLYGFAVYALHYVMRLERLLKLLDLALVRKKALQAQDSTASLPA